MPLSTHLLITTTRAIARLGSRTFRSFEKSVLPPELDSPHGSLAVRLIDHCGFTSHFDDARGLSSWPVPRGMTVQQLAIFAMGHDLLTGEPEAGDIFLQYSPSKKTFVHAGIVIGVKHSGQFNAASTYYDVYTIEGDVNDKAHWGGGRTMKINRRFTSAQGDRFIRWAALQKPVVQLVDTQWSALTRRTA